MDRDRRHQWRFVMADDGWRWIVAQPDGQEQTSGTFPTLMECTADANRHGYVAWKTEDERRREHELAVSKALFRDDGAGSGSA